VFGSFRSGISNKDHMKTSDENVLGMGRSASFSDAVGIV
jgi:hypothetical protein